ncbi:hypothetical protein [Adhaeretor mobilis]|uniref:Uncharacterized protein n=1 Tax=Adhaeretor mobilis TaxID=1930276 RepID=A0A517MV91_9BACT|nr:hypothetical protein [Adhaeretor mobilis]QDS98795.1 hypothetical protein HG15A2_20800 [Adhaeretor mobilis]
MISGLVAHLTAEAGLAQATVSAIAEQPNLEVGVQQELRLPLVLETTTSVESQAVTDWLHELPGITHVDVAFVHLDECSPEESVPASQATSCSELRN